MNKLIKLFVEINICIVCFRIFFFILVQFRDEIKSYIVFWGELFDKICMWFFNNIEK